MAVLAATGLDNVAPATLNLVGDDALYVNTDYFKIVHFKLGDAVTEWNLSAASPGGWLVAPRTRTLTL
jgi:hypothetical protein